MNCGGRYADAEAAAAAARPMAAEVFGASHQRTANIHVRLAEVYLRTDRAAQGEPYLRHAIGVFDAIDPRYFRTGGARAQLGEALLELGRHEEGAGEVEAGYDILAETVQPDTPRMLRFAELLADPAPRGLPAGRRERHRRG